MPIAFFYKEVFICISVISLRSFCLYTDFFTQASLSCSFAVFNTAYIFSCRSRCQTFSNLYLPVQISAAIDIICIIKLIGQSIENLINSCFRSRIYAAAVRAQSYSRAGFSSLHRKIATQNFFRVTVIMLINNHSITAVFVYGYILAVTLLENNACSTCTATCKFADMACSIAADIFIILCITCIIGLVYPACTVLQPHIYCAAIIYNAAQIGIIRSQSYIYRTCFQREDIATKLNAVIAGRCAIFTGIDVNGSLICSQGIVTIIHTLRNINLTTANRYRTVLGIRCNTIAIHIHISSTADIYTAVLNLCKNTCVVKARQHIICIYRNTPCFAVRALYSQIAVNRNCVGNIGSIAGFTPTVCFLYSNAITAVAAVHRDINISVNSNLAGSRFAGIIHDSIIQGITIHSANSNNIQFTCINSNILTIAGINTDRCSNTVLYLQLQSIAAGVDSNIITVMRINSSQNIIS